MTPTTEFDADRRQQESRLSDYNRRIVPKWHIPPWLEWVGIIAATLAFWVFLGWLLFGCAIPVEAPDSPLPARLPTPMKAGTEIRTDSSDVASWHDWMMMAGLEQFTPGE